jgi:tetratricopeptide (TPR) repeat protein
MKRKPLLLSCMVVVGLSLATPSPLRAQLASQNTTARTLFSEGRNFWDEGRLDDAEKKFREALTKYPKAEQSDRTAFYLITTLVQLGRNAEARREIDIFNRKYPQSSWKSDVEEKRLALNGLPSVAWGRSQLGFRGNNMGGPQRGVTAEVVAHNVQVSPPGFAIHMNPNVSLDQEVLRLIIEMDFPEGIRLSRERLKGNPSDPAVIANFSTIGSGNPSQALPFLLTVAGDAQSSPHTRTQAVFVVRRRVMKEEESVPVVADTLSRFSDVERRNAVDQMVQTRKVEGTAVLQKIYNASSNAAVRMQIVESVGSAPDVSTVPFLSEVARNEKELGVRRIAIQSLARLPNVDVKTWEGILKTLPPPGVRGPAK